MRAKTIILVCLMLIPLFLQDLNAEDVSKRHKVSLAGHTSVILMENDGLVGLGLNLDFRPAPQFSFGADIVMGIDSDGEAYTTLIPAISYHFLKAKKTDLFAGVGLNTVISRPDSSNSDFRTMFLGFGGARLFLSSHFGFYFRVFVSDRIFGGFSLGLTFNL